MKRNLIEAFTAGALEAMKIQCSTDFKVFGSCSNLTDAGMKGDIGSIIQVTGKDFCGTVFLQFPESTFLYVMCGMIGEQFAKLTPDIEDGAGELLNIIFGFAKRHLSERDYQLEMAIPVTLNGAELEQWQQANQQSTAILFSSEGGNFCMGIAQNDSLSL